MVINPIVGVYIPVIRIPIKGGMAIPNMATFDHGTSVNNKFQKNLGDLVKGTEMVVSCGSDNSWTCSIQKFWRENGHFEEDVFCYILKGFSKFPHFFQALRNKNTLKTIPPASHLKHWRARKQFFCNPKDLLLGTDLEEELAEGTALCSFSLTFRSKQTMFFCSAKLVEDGSKVKRPKNISGLNMVTPWVGCKHLGRTMTFHRFWNSQHDLRFINPPNHPKKIGEIHPFHGSSSSSSSSSSPSSTGWWFPAI